MQSYAEDLVTRDTVRRPSPPLSAMPPGPREPAIVQTIRFFRDPVRFLKSARDRYGEPFTIRLVGLGTGAVISEPESIRKLVTGSPETIHAGEANAPIAPYMGRFSLLILDGPLHMEHRRLMLPPFHGSRLAPYGDLISRLAEEEIKTWSSGTEFRLHESMDRLTLEVILRVIFGVSDEARLNALRQVVPKFMGRAEKAVYWGLITARDLGRFGPQAKFRTAKAELDSLMYAEIADHRRDPELEDRTDVLSTLCLAKHEDGSPMSDVEIRDELVTMVMAGNHSTGTALAWAMDLLLHNASVLDRLRSEVAAGDDAYLEAVVRETLRIRTTLPFFGRVIDEPREVGGVRLPADATVAVSPLLLHYRDDIYPQPEVFRPERFLDAKPESYSWLPFGAGVRRCVGSSLAELEMKQILAQLVTTDLEPVDVNLDRMIPAGVIVKPKRGVRVRLNSVLDHALKGEVRSNSSATVEDVPDSRPTTGISAS